MSDDKPNDVADVIRTKRIEIVDAAGEIKALISTDVSGMPCFEMRDTNGSLRLYVSMDAPNPKIEVCGSDEGARLIITVQNDGPYIVFKDDRGVERLSLQMPDGYPILNMANSSGEIAFAVGIEPDGSAKMLGRAKDGKADRWP